MPGGRWRWFMCVWCAYTHSKDNSIPIKACQNPEEPLPWVKWTSTTNLQWNPATSCSRWPCLRAQGATSSASPRMKLIRASTLKLFQPLKLNSAWISRRRFLPPPCVSARFVTRRLLCEALHLASMCALAVCGLFTASPSGCDAWSGFTRLNEWVNYI